MPGPTPPLASRRATRRARAGTLDPLYRFQIIQRDKLGRITEKSETIEGVGPAETFYEYDAAGRLWRVCGDQDCTAMRSEYLYDSNGNRTVGSYINTQGSVTTATYDDQGRLTMHTTDPGGMTTFVYGDNGELQTKSDARASPATPTTRSATFAMWSCRAARSSTIWPGMTTSGMARKAERFSSSRLCTVQPARSRAASISSRARFSGASGGGGVIPRPLGIRQGGGWVKSLFQKEQGEEKIDGFIARRVGPPCVIDGLCREQGGGSCHSHAGRSLRRSRV
jgi:YD repeat-containing protein